MSPAIVKVDSAAVRALLKSAEVTADLEDRAIAIWEAAGEDGFEVVVRQGPNRVHVEVQTETYEAAKGEATDKVLTKAIDAGRQ